MNLMISRQLAEIEQTATKETVTLHGRDYDVSNTTNLGSTMIVVSLFLENILSHILLSQPYIL